MTEIIVGTVIDIEIDIALDAWEAPHISMLPEFPLSFILERIYVVVGYPVGILVEDRVVEIAHLKLKISIDDRFNLIVLLNHVQPLEYRTLKLGISLFLRLMFYVEHRRKIAIFKFYGVHKMPGLLVGRCMDTIEMIGTTGKTILTGLIEIVAEVLIGLGSTLSGLDHDETDGTLVDRAIVLEFVPVDAPLMVGNVDTVDLIAFGIADIAIEGTPSKSERRNEEIIKEPDIACNNCCTTYPPTP